MVDAINDGLRCGCRCRRVRDSTCRAETETAQTVFKMEKSSAVEARHTVNMSVDEMHYSQTSPVDLYGKDSYPRADMNRLRRFV